MKKITVIAILFHVFLLTAVVNATEITFVETTAILDWDSFNISTDSGMMIEWTSQSTYPWGINGWSDDLDVTENHLLSSTKWWTVNGEMGTTASVNYGENLSNLNRIGDFIVSGSGYIYFSIDYHLEYTVSGAWGETYANVLFTLDGRSDGDAGSWASIGDGNYVSNDFFQNPVTVIEDGTLYISNYYNDGDAGHFQSWVATESYTLSSPTPVPEPATITLISIGMIALLGKFKFSLIKKTSHSTA